MDLSTTTNFALMNGASGLVRTFASPCAAPAPCGWLVTSAETVSTGRFGMLVTARFRWTACRVWVVLADSCTIWAASGSGPVAVAAVEVVLESSDPQPVTTAANSEAAIATVPNRTGESLPIRGLRVVEVRVDKSLMFCPQRVHMVHRPGLKLAASAVG